jgi:hypothetical protein
MSQFAQFSKIIIIIIIIINKKTDAQKTLKIVVFCI